MCPFDYSFTPSRGPSRSDAAQQGREVVSIVEAKGYVAPSGTPVDLTEALGKALASVRDYPPGARVDASAPRFDRTRVSVVNGTSLAAARAMASRGAVPLVLNFASAKHPGGGYLSGARAQEESLARSSALAACLATSPMYAHHRAGSDALYTSWMIHTPDVPVFRDDETGTLLDEPYTCAFLTGPAPNAKVVLERDPSRRGEVMGAMAERVGKALAIAAAHGHGHLVLGAWGCGVFGNDPEHVAGCFARELEASCSGAFEEIVFAVLDWSDERRFIRPFAERFAS